VDEGIGRSITETVVIPTEVSINEVLDRKVMSILEHSKESIKFMNECFNDEVNDQMDQCKEGSSFCLGKTDHALRLDNTLREAAELSIQFDLFKEKELKDNCNSLIRAIDPFGVIPHIEYTHGYCRSVPGGSMHLIFQFFISIEKVVLLPVSLTNLSYKLLLDSYGQISIDLSEFENEMRGIRILQDLSTKKIGILPSMREMLFQDFIYLMVFKLGVPSFFKFSLKQSFTCSSCSDHQSKIIPKFFLKVKCNSLIRDSSITELLR
jgi:hypothetical protein